MTEQTQGYTSPQAPTASGGRHPNPEYFGFDWKALRPLLDEHGGLAKKLAEASREVRDLEKKLEQAEAMLPTKRAEAIRKSEAFDPAYVEELKTELEDARGSWRRSSARGRWWRRTSLAP